MNFSTSLRGAVRRPAPFVLVVLTALVAQWATLATPVQAAGVLTPVGNPDAPIDIREHHVDVLIVDGFARTEVRQTFLNPSAVAMEALYVFPVPEDGALAEYSVQFGETEFQGEVMAKAKAELEPLYARFASMKPEDIAKDPQAQAIGDLAAANEGDMALTTGTVYDVWDNQSDPSGWWQVADPQTGER